MKLLEKLDHFLESLDKKGKVVMATPKVMNTMGAKDALYKIRDLNCGLRDTEVYYTEEDLKDNLSPFFLHWLEVAII